MTVIRRTVCLLASMMAAISLVSAEQRRGAINEEHPGWQSVEACSAHSVRVARGTDWANYTVVRLMPADYRPNNLRRRLNLAQTQKMTSDLDADLNRAFRKTAPGEGSILDIRPVIFDVKKSNVVINVLSFAAINAAVSYGRASVRYELIDDASGYPVGEIRYRGNARPWNIYPWQILSSFKPLGHSYIMLHRGAKALRKDMHKIETFEAAQQGDLSNQAGN